ncbi:MAG: hypothetical protein R3F46_01090 [bacterium]
MRSTVLLQEISRLKLRLTIRHFRKNVGNTIALIVAWLGMGFGALAGCGAIVVTLLGKGGDAPAEAARILIWVMWVIALVWMFSPFAQIDLQRNLDLNGLRLMPLSGSQFLLAVLLDALLSPLGLFVIPYSLLFLAALAFGGLAFPAMLVSLLLLVAILLCYAQAVYLLVSRLLQSRRFAEISMGLGLLIVVLVQIVNFGFLGGIDNIGGDIMHSPLAVLVGPVQALLAWSFPTLAARAAEAASSGDLPTALRDWGLLLCWLAPGLLFVGRTARAFYEGELESGGRADEGATARPQGRGLSALLPDGALAALVQREQRYAKRDPLLRSLLLQSLFFGIYTCVMMVLIRGRIMSEVRADWEHHHIVNYVLLGLSFSMTYAESGILFNRFGYDGQSMATLLASPVSRLSLLRARSLFLLSHLGGVNLLLVLTMGLLLGCDALYIVAALVMIVANILIVDMLGSFLSIAYPFTFVRRGQRVRAVMPQQGCGYLLLYALLFNFCNLLVAPGSLAIILGTVLHDLPGMLGGSLLALLIAGLAWHFGTGQAVGFLEQREHRLLESLSRQPD